MDEADAGNEMAEKLQAAYMAVRKEPGPAANGTCHYCREEVTGDKRWCDADCMTDYFRVKTRGGVL